LRNLSIAVLGILLLWWAQVAAKAQQRRVPAASGARATQETEQGRVPNASPASAGQALPGGSNHQGGHPVAPPVSSSVRPTEAAIASYMGLRVREIQFRGIARDSAIMRELRQLVLQPVDAPLDRTKIRRSIQRLYATGLLSDLQVEAERNPQNEITLVFAARPNYFFGEITVDGQPRRRPRANQLVNAAKLRLGELYSQEKIATAIDNMLAVLRDNGFYKAQISHEEQFHPETQLVDVRFHVNADGNAHIGTVTIQGDPGYSQSEIERTAGFQPGRTVTAEHVAKALQKLRKKYQKNHRLEAQVGIVDRAYHPENNSLDYVFRINEGPVVDVQVAGARLSRGRLKKLVPVFEEGAIDDDLLNEGQRNLRNYFQTRGYFDVRVNWTRESAPETNKVSVVYHVQPGQKHKLVAVRFEGAHYFSADLLRERMQIRPASGLLTNGLYSESLLSGDIASIVSLYKANGFQHISVERQVQDDYLGAKGDILVILRIHEGPQVKVASVQLAGNRTFDDASLRQTLTTIPGQPFSELNIATDRESIMNTYVNHGFSDVQCSASATPVAGDPNQMNVVYTITEGSQVFVNRVLISGLQYTRPYIVSRELLVQPGSPLDQSAMLESQRRLYDLGLFNEVDVAVQNPEGQSQYKDLLFQVREARRWTFNYGFGFQLQSGQTGTINEVNTAPAPGVSVPPNTTPPSGGVPVGTNIQGGTGFSPDFLFEVTRLNFRGRGHTVSFKGRYGNLLKRALGTYDAPRFFENRNLRLGFTGFFENSRDVRTFSSERLEGSAQIEQALTRRADGQPISTLMWRYNYRRVVVDPNSLAISPELVPLYSKPVLVGMPSVGFTRDKRDDPLDPHKGNYTTFDFGVSARAFGSASVKGAQQVLQGPSGQPLPQTVTTTASNWIRVMTQNSTYTPIWHGITFARSTRISIEHPFGNTANPLSIPLPERFFSGGLTSHRGFSLNQAGPRDLTTGFPLGGNALFVNNFELRFPPPTLPLVGTDLSFVLFHDAGNVFESATAMGHSLFRWYQPHRQDCRNGATFQQCRFDYMAQAAGVGIRYRTPIGPVRVDLSYNPNPPSFPFFVQCPAAGSRNDKAPCNALPPSTPNNPTLVFQNATLRRFNFFFSIGQSF
jgi:outer membrane protein insertion porin family